MNHFSDELTIPELLEARSEQQGDRSAFRFLYNGNQESHQISFKELLDWSNEIAIGLSKITKPGDCAVLCFTAGLEFIATFYACLKIGVVAVPVAHPGNRAHHWQRLSKVVDDCRANLLLTEASTIDIAQKHWGDNEHPELFCLDALDKTGDLPTYNIKASDVAYLQYTSGSTGTPKGVMMTHTNVLHNVQAIESGFSVNSSDIAVSWLPHHHDMGLVGVIILGLWVGIPVILMAPVAFLQNPLCWLRAISRYKGTYSGAPNFGYSFCVEQYAAIANEELDLSSWRLAFNGAEPVRAETLNRFAKTFSEFGFNQEALAPCYGIAEATLAVSLTPRKSQYKTLKLDKAMLEQRVWYPSANGVELVSSGKIAGEQTLAIVNPETLKECESCEIGEIWISGPSVSVGYWKNSEQSAKSMEQQLPNYPEQTFLRTGDLGYIDKDELYIAGRIKDVIIIRGRNHYPQDIELTVEESADFFRNSGCAAFSCDINGDQNLIVVQEVERVAIRHFNPEKARQLVIKNVALKHDIRVNDVVFILPISLPKTSSGKVQRSRAKQLYLKDELNRIKERSVDVGRSKPDTELTETQVKLGSIASRIMGSESDLGLSLLSQGFDSLGIIRFKQEVESTLAKECPLHLLFENHPIAELERFLVDKTYDDNQELDITNQNLQEIPLAENQKSLWLAQRLQPHSGAYNIAVPFVLNCAIDVESINAAWQACVARHPILQMTIANDIANLSMVARTHPNIAFCHTTDGYRSKEQILSAVRETAQRPPKLESPQLSALHYWQESESRIVLAFVLHHVVADMWSILNLLDDFLQALRGEKLQPTPPSFVEYAARKSHLPEQLEVNRRYWQDKFSEFGDSTLQLPLKANRPNKRSGHADSAYFTLEAKTTEQLKALAKGRGTTLHNLMLAVYALVLARYSGQSVLTIGGPTFGREDARFNETVGFFVNTVVYQVVHQPNRSFNDFLMDLNKEVSQVLQHQHIAFSDIVKSVGHTAKAGTHPLYQSSFTFQQSHRLNAVTPMIINGPKELSLDLEGIDLSTYPLTQHSCQVDVALTMVKHQGEIQGRLDFATDVLTQSTMQQFAASIKNVAKNLPAVKSRPVGSIAIQEKRSPLYEEPMNISAKRENTSIYEAIFNNPLSCPSQQAVVSQDESLSYQQLNTRIQKIAGHLAGLNVTKGEHVALACSRSPYWAAAILAIWHVGAVYVPIDEYLPAGRVADILEQTSPAAVLVDKSCNSFFEDGVVMEDLPERDAPALPHTPVNKDDAAYIIFTSGSTGKPKGVVVNHGSLYNRINWLTKHIPLQTSERVAQKTPMSFDVSIWELFWPLAAGGTAVFVDNRTRKDPVKLYAFIEQHHITSCQFVPSFLATFIKLNRGAWPTSLTRVICGGESFTPSLYSSLRSISDAEIHDLYGPTECGFVTHKQIHTNNDTTELGSPIDHTNVVVLDEDDRPTPEGVVGEIVVIGDAVGIGYLGNVSGGFGLSLSGERFYRTGDIASYQNGEIHFLGRKDNQVKLRGYRIELGEIESVIEKQAGVLASHCEVIGEHEHQRLLLWLHSDVDQIEETIKSACQLSLPSYMNPDQIIVMDTWPLTRHGKLDTHALPRNQYCSTESKESPMGELEWAIAKIWQDILKVNNIYRQTNFFSVGGHSLLAAVMVNELHTKFSINAEVQLVFEAPTLEQFAENIRRYLPSELDTEIQDDEEEFVI